MAHEVFISYKSQHIEIVKAISHIFEEQKIRTWYAPRDLDSKVGGLDFDDAILKAIRSCRVVVAIISNEALESRWVKLEITKAWDLNKIVIPYVVTEILVDNGLKMQLDNKHWIDAYPNPERKFNILLNNIKILLNQLPVEADQPVREQFIIHELQSYDDDFEFIEGTMLYETKEYRDAVIALSTSAESGNIKAQKLISKIFYDLDATGNYDLIDDTVWNIIKRQAEQGHAYANFAMHTKHYRTKDDYLISFNYLKIASRDKSLGYPFLRLGIHYGWGMGVKVNNLLAIQWYQKAIEAGIIEAYSYMGQAYEFGGIKIDKNEEKAIEFYILGAKQNDIRAIRNLGSLYRRNKDTEKALTCFERMIELSNFRGYVEIGLMYDFNNEKEDATKYYKMGAEHNVKDAYGNISALFWNEGQHDEAIKWARSGMQMHDSWSAKLLGFYYEVGCDSLKSDLAMAWKYYLIAYELNGGGNDAIALAKLFIDKGYRPENITIEYIIELLDIAARNLDDEAICLLIMLYQEHKLIEENLEKHIEYIKLGAEASVSEYMFELGIRHLNGNGVILNPYMGYQWIEKASKKGYKEAISKLLIAYKEGIYKDKQKYKDCLINAIECGISDPAYFCELGKQYSHATMYECDNQTDIDSGLSVEEIERDNQLAFQYFEKAAQLDYAEAYIRMYEIESSKIDLDNCENCEVAKKCFEWVRIAAEKGNTQAVLDMGVLYQVGLGVPIDLDKAIKWYISAAHKGNKHAPLNIGKLYMGEDSYPKDLLLARSWLKRAYKLENENAKELLDEINEEIKTETLAMEQAMLPALMGKYLSYIYPDINQGNDHVLEKLYQPCIKATENMTLAESDSLPSETMHERAYLSKDIKVMLRAWNDFKTARRNLHLQPACYNLKDTEIYPCFPYFLIKELRQEIAEVWLELKKTYSEKLTNISLLHNNEILDLAEKEQDEDLQLLLISIVECDIELDNMQTCNEELCMLYEKAQNSLQSNTILKLAEMYYAGTNYCVRSYSIAKHWYEQVSDELISIERLALLKDVKGIYSQTNSITIKGTVVNENHKPIAGVNVSLSDSTQGTMTDLDGRYNFSIPQSGTLLFRYKGYEEYHVDVNMGSIIDIVMKLESEDDEFERLLDEFLKAELDEN